MSVYSTITDILSAGNANILELGTSLENELPLKIRSTASATLFTSSAAGPTVINTISGVVIAPDDIVVCVSNVFVSGSNTADRFALSHAIDGTALAAQYWSRFTPPASSTSGDTDTVPVFTAFQDQTAGTKEITLRVGTVSGGAPSGTFYAQLNNLYVIIAKRRA